MNTLEQCIDAMLDAVVDIAAVNNNISKNMILGRCRQENVMIARCLLVSQLAASGYPTTIIAQAVNRRPQTVRSLYALARYYHKTSKAYRLAESQLQTRCRDIIAAGK